VLFLDPEDLLFQKSIRGFCIPVLNQVRVVFRVVEVDISLLYDIWQVVWLG